MVLGQTALRITATYWTYSVSANRP